MLTQPGIGAKDLFRFYDEFFIPNNPETMKIKVLSRTVGVDRVVDEMLVTFRHTQEIPWMLPGIPPTDKEVEVVLVSVVCIRGGRLYHEHIHWDQATVLVQIGLLDPKLIPDTFKTAEKGREKEVKQLPVCGKEAARKTVNEKDGKSNELIPGWAKASSRSKKSHEEKKAPKEQEDMGNDKDGEEQELEQSKQKQSQHEDGAAKKAGKPQTDKAESSGKAKDQEPEQKGKTDVEQEHEKEENTDQGKGKSTEQKKSD